MSEKQKRHLQLVPDHKEDQVIQTPEQIRQAEYLKAAAEHSGKEPRHLGGGIDRIFGKPANFRDANHNELSNISKVGNVDYSEDDFSVLTEMPRNLRVTLHNNNAREKWGKNRVVLEIMEDDTLLSENDRIHIYLIYDEKLVKHDHKTLGFRLAEDDTDAAGLKIYKNSSIPAGDVAYWLEHFTETPPTKERPFTVVR